MANWLTRSLEQRARTILKVASEIVRRIGSLRLTGLSTLTACLLCLLQFALLRPLESAFAVAPPVIA